MVGPESADASMVSLGSQLTTSSSTAATQRLSDSVSSRFGHWRGFKVRHLALRGREGKTRACVYPVQRGWVQVGMV